ncbi:MAG: IS1595 family transposase [Candidatus Aureabacteria bacterium]|nr:IS1595 family transposase [Candidatus Auribacterota bacterium]
MVYQYQPLNLVEFFAAFPTEEACEYHLIRVRWPEGMVCNGCGGKDFYRRIRTRRVYQCRYCRHLTSPTAGTILHKTRTSLQRWFLALFLIASDKRGCSALLLSKQIGVDYDTAWAMLHRIRHAMATRDVQYKLSGLIEMDEMFIGAPTEGKKRGRGTEQTPVLVAVSFFTGKRGGEYMGFAAMRVVGQIDTTTVVAFAKEAIEPGSRVRTDGLSVYPALEKHGFLHDPNPVRRRKAHTVLPHVHTFVSNLRAFVLGTYHGLGEKHLQQYLDEFCYRFNRRRHHDELFDRLLLACLEKDEMPLSVLTR